MGTESGAERWRKVARLLLALIWFALTMIAMRCGGSPWHRDCGELPLTGASRTMIVSY